MYMPIGSTRQIQSVDVIEATPTIVMAVRDPAAFTVAYANCMWGQPAATDTFCQVSAKQAQVTDSSNRLDAAILALYNAANAASPGSGDKILADANLFLVKR